MTLANVGYELALGLYNPVHDELLAIPLTISLMDWVFLQKCE